MNNKPKVVCILGPTASGKSKIALNLAQTLPCSIISVDSGMVYIGLDIGTAKPNKDELAMVPHKLIDICDPAHSYSVGKFYKDAINAIEEVRNEGKIPLLVGGTMMYFYALQKGLSKLPKKDINVRAKIEQEIKLRGLEAVHAKLKSIDPVIAGKISMGDKQRIQRALEIYEISGKPPSVLFAENKKLAAPYTFINIAVGFQHKNDLVERIKSRLDTMLKQGFLDEVASLYKRPDLNPDLPSIRSVGYRQAWQYLDGKFENSEAMREAIIIATRQLAKRQMTWLRSWQNLKWFSADNPSLVDDINDYILNMF